MRYASEPLPSYRYLRNRFYTIDFKKILISSGSLYLLSHVLFPPSHIYIIIPIILYSPLQSSYMGQQVTCAAMVSCLRFIYSFIGHSPAVSSASATRSHSRSPHVVRCSVIPVILLATWWWKPSSTLIISTITTKLLLLYNNTDCTNELYSIPRAHTADPVLKKNSSTTTHRLRAFPRFYYRSAQLLLLYETVQPRYGNAAAGAIGSEFTLIKTRLASKHRFRVLLLPPNTSHRLVIALVLRILPPFASVW